MVMSVVVGSSGQGGCRQLESDLGISQMTQREAGSAALRQLLEMLQQSGQPEAGQEWRCEVWMGDPGRSRQRGMRQRKIQMWWKRGFRESTRSMLV